MLLSSKYGIKFHDYEGMSCSSSKHGKKYYLHESTPNMKIYKEIHK